jgi:hypothetical protein
MKRLLLAVVLIAGQAHAEWVRYDVTDSTIAYYDPSTISKTGPVAMVWTIDSLGTNSKPRIKWDWVSIRSLMEINCSNGKQRSVQATAHELDMGAGNILFTKSSPAEWEYTAPGTVGAALQTLICGSQKRV